ncbi:hypothetical protein GQX74_006205 [Glossina fuscipes]|nr:hypothetical protein GQX74_006205 [Glossina fuscipes]
MIYDEMDVVETKPLHWDIRKSLQPITSTKHSKLHIGKPCTAHVALVKIVFWSIECRGSIESPIVKEGGSRVLRLHPGRHKSTELNKNYQKKLTNILKFPTKSIEHSYDKTHRKRHIKTSTFHALQADYGRHIRPFHIEKIVRQFKGTGPTTEFGITIEPTARPKILVLSQRLLKCNRTITHRPRERAHTISSSSISVRSIVITRQPYKVYCEHKQYDQHSQNDLIKSSQMFK